ncbi:MAG: hypothetical protein PHD37_04150 [Gallionellaceae bacterium]|nr:hypothetical protein [Gallionellaceae bacterium]
MSYPKPRLPWLVGMIVGMTPLVTNAHAEQTSEQIACPILLTEQECRDYQMEQRQARSELDRVSFEDKYTTLLTERSRLCPLSNLDVANKVGHSPGTTRLRFLMER